MPALLKLLRPRQWLKNGFVLAPIFFGAKLFDPELLRSIGLAFVCFCLISSATYVLNDLCDLEADRLHAKKKTRPLASGAVKPITAVIVIIVLVIAAVAIALFGGLPIAFHLAVAAYVIINLSYSFGLKDVAILELFLISSGFIVRLLAGGEVGQIALSPWIVTVTGLISLMLAAGKRRGDLAQNNDEMKLRKSLREYSVEFLDAQLSAIAGATLVVYVLFCTSDYAVQRYGPFVLITTVPVAMGIMRFMLLVIVRGSGDDPTNVVMRDPFMMAVILVFLLIFATLIYAVPRV
jgi:decaprenyl-phosphate phosphoribosyltransferase